MQDDTKLGNSAGSSGSGGASKIGEKKRWIHDPNSKWKWWWFCVNSCFCFVSGGGILHRHVLLSSLPTNTVLLNCHYQQQRNPPKHNSTRLEFKTCVCRVNNTGPPPQGFLFWHRSPRENKVGGNSAFCRFTGKSVKY